MTFLAPADAAFLHGLRHVVAEATRLYEAHRGHPVPEATVPLTMPHDAYMLLGPQMEELLQEHFMALTLNRRNRLLAMHLIYQGSVSSAIVRMAEVFRPAILDSATGIIVAHNHPSGDPAPSPEDIHVTRLLIETGRLLDIEVMDHLIIGRGQYVSMRERGMGFDGMTTHRGGGAM